MSMAFEITPDDVRNVLSQNGHKDVSNENVQKAFDELDLDSVESAALVGGCDLDSQTEAAYEEIRSQLVQEGWLPLQDKDQTKPMACSCHHCG